MRSISLSFSLFFFRERTNCEKFLRIKVTSYWPRNERYILHGTCLFLYMCYVRLLSRNEFQVFFLRICWFVFSRVYLIKVLACKTSCFRVFRSNRESFEKGARVDFFLFFTFNRSIKLSIVSTNLSFSSFHHTAKDVRDPFHDRRVDFLFYPRVTRHFVQSLT